MPSLKEVPQGLRSGSDPSRNIMPMEGRLDLQAARMDPPSILLTPSM